MADTRQPEPEREEPGTRINPVVFYGSSVCILAIALWTMIDPDGAAATIGILVGWISEWFGWFYILIATLFLAFVVFLALSRYGNTKLGRATSPLTCPIARKGAPWNPARAASLPRGWPLRTATAP